MMLKYEKLPNHCFKCGLVIHTTQECQENKPIPIVNGKEVPIYGPWLRATKPIRRSRFQDQRSVYYSPNITDSNWKKGRGKEPMIPKPTTGEGTNLNSNIEMRKEDVTERGGSSNVVPDESSLLENIDEEVCNVESKGTGWAAINGEKQVKKARGVGSEGLYDQVSKTLPIPQVGQTPTKWTENEAHKPTMKDISISVEKTTEVRPTRPFEEEKTFTNPVSSNSIFEGPSIQLSPYVKINQLLKDKRGTEREDEKFEGRRKARKVDGSQVIDEKTGKNGSLCISDGEVTNIMVLPTEEKALEALTSTRRSQ
ncbi:hypothetical protein QYF36_008308 [Acer negundo]|nr:hypothetical protein QYF36_008308 [Acer negundo]